MIFTVQVLYAQVFEVPCHSSALQSTLEHGRQRDPSPCYAHMHPSAVEGTNACLEDCDTNPIWYRFCTLALSVLVTFKCDSRSKLRFRAWLGRLDTLEGLNHCQVGFPQCSRGACRAKYCCLGLAVGTFRPRDTGHKALCPVSVRCGTTIEVSHVSWYLKVLNTPTD